MALLTVGGVAQRTPSKMKVTINDIDGDSTRNANGDLIRDRIGTKTKIELAFPPLSQAEISTLLSAVSPVFFTVTYQDPMDGMTTKTFYVGDRTAPILVYGNGSTDLKWEGLDMNFVEQ